MKIVHVAFECSPIYKTGGLGDVVGSLPIAQFRLGIKLLVIIPAYSFIKRRRFLPHSEVPVWYIESPWFKKPGIRTDRKTQAVGFAAFAVGILSELKRRDLKPDIIHCHDWHTGLISFLLKKTADPFFAKTRTLLTLHNIGYQGRFPKKYLHIPEFKELFSHIPAQAKQISFLKEGIAHADFVSTVSPNHAQEIRRGTVGFGLSAVIKKKRGRFVGIVNGLDHRIWNPTNDHALHKRFGKRSLASAKAINKRALQAELGLFTDPNIPLFVFVGRLSQQKGLDLLLPVLPGFAGKMQFALLGAGDGAYLKAVSQYKKTEFSKWISMSLHFNEKLARQMYAGADFLLIPSLYEPCGLTQMIAMAYGTIPVACRVGGLKDTIRDEKTGILFSEKSKESLINAIERSLLLFFDKERCLRMRKLCMRQDFSWDKSAKRYIRLYRHIKQL